MSGSLAEAASHNVPPEVFLRHYRDIRDCKQAHGETGTALARAKKAAKKDGIDLDALKMLEKLADLDTDEAALQLGHLKIYAGWLELPIGSQLDAFGAPAPLALDAKVQQEQREWVAGGQGFEAGKAGNERDLNPHQAGSSEYVAWDKSWANGNKLFMKGQKKLAGELGARANGAKPPAAAKRGRAARAH